MATRAPIPQVTGVTAEAVLSEAQVQAILDAKAQLGALGPAVQTLVNAGIVTAQARSGHNGNDPAANVVYANGQTAEQYKAIVDAFMSGIPTSSIPNVTADPTIGGSATVGTTLTATLGAVTNGTSGSHTDRIQWNRNLAGAVTAIPNATAITYPVVAGDQTYQLSVSHTPIDGAAPFLQGNTRTSVPTAVVTGTPPTNTGAAPSVSPSGGQISGQTHTVNPGGWTGAASFTYLQKDNGVDIGTRSSSTTFTTNSGQDGHTVTGNVVAISALGVASAPVAWSNSISVSGTNVIAMTVVPTLTRANGEAAGVVYSGYAYPIVGATLTVNGTVTVASSRQWDFYVNGAYYASNTAAQVTIDGAMPVGATLKVAESGVVGGIAYTTNLASLTTFTSTAAPATLATQLVTASNSFVSGTTITPYTPVTATGGSGTKSWAISPSLPSSLSLNTANGQISGVANTVGSANYTITVSDTGGSTPASQVTGIAITSAVSITKTFEVRPDTAPGTQPRSILQSCNQNLYLTGSPLEVGDWRSTPYTGGQATTVNGSTTRFGVETINGAPWIRMAVGANDPDTAGTGAKRTDIQWSGIANMVHGDVFWWAFKWRVPAFVWGRSPGAGVGNFALLFDLHSTNNSQSQIALRSWEGASRGLMFQRDTYDEVELGSFITADTDVSIVYCEQISEQNGTGFNRLWINGTQRVNASGRNHTESGSSYYPKQACYNGGAVQSGGYQWWIKHCFMVRDNAQQYTEPQIRALLL